MTQNAINSPESDELASTIGNSFFNSFFDRPSSVHLSSPSRAFILSKFYKYVGKSFKILWNLRGSNSLKACLITNSENYQLTFPLRVLISPLWPMTRIGWARSQLGKVFVENRECTCRKYQNNQPSYIIPASLFKIWKSGAKSLKPHTWNCVRATPVQSILQCQYKRKS